MAWYFWVLLQALGHVSDYLFVCLSSEVVMVDHGLSIIGMQDRDRFVIASIRSLSRGHVQFGEALLQIDIEILKCGCIFLSCIALSRVRSQESGVVLLLHRVC